MLHFGISSAMILVCDVPCRAVVRGSFAIPFAKLPPAGGYERGVGQTRSLRSSWHAAIPSRHLQCVPRTGSVMQCLGAGYRLRDPCNSLLLLPHPVRKERQEHEMSNRLLFLIHLERSGIGEIG